MREAETMPADSRGLPAWFHKALRPCAAPRAFRASLRGGRLVDYTDNPLLSIASRSISVAVAIPPNRGGF
jgi:hypothetical protein